MTTITLSATYTTSYNAEFVLPEGKTPSDIESIYTKWMNSQITFTDGTTMEVDHADSEGSDDYKRPNEVALFDEDFDLIDINFKQ